ncbi:hypothetical protein B0H67DRAFT_639210 [Lasiosphaeris hirsuta]|uniref:Uncharacterized protein n=1 Tax=Lasiosphaeris hirsuta TaxID=260670 RepID=A0AA40BB38_9PEZI|nr:hypothetical protein B0H67DRAFT_639210 [Lasiosphaeris hirsuta]
MSDEIGHVFLTRFWIFQGLLAAPTFFIFGIFIFASLWDSYNGVYDFVCQFFNCLLAGSILFIILVQRSLPTASKKLTYRFELAKSVLATAMWLWLMLDSIFYKRRYYNPDLYYYRRIIISAISSTALFILFYPTALYTAYLVRKDRQEGGEEAAAAVEEAEGRRDADEWAPLLPNETV